MKIFFFCMCVSSGSSMIIGRDIFAPVCCLCYFVQDELTVLMGMDSPPTDLFGLSPVHPVHEQLSPFHLPSLPGLGLS